MLRYLWAVFLVQSAVAVEYAPWFGPLFSTSAQLSFRYETYHTLASSAGNIPYPAYNRFYQLEMEIIPWIDWEGQLDFDFANTEENHFGFSRFALTVRHLLYESSGVAATVGATLAGLPAVFLRDVSLSDHGTIHADAHLSIGKEWAACGDRWTALWGVGGVGLGNQGAPWVYARGVFERGWECHRGLVRLDYLQGLGAHALELSHFAGYSAVAHRSLDVTVGYGFAREWGEWLFVYGYRPYAHNFPRAVNGWLVCFRKVLGSV